MPHGKYLFTQRFNCCENASTLTEELRLSLRLRLTLAVVLQQKQKQSKQAQLVPAAASSLERRNLFDLARLLWRTALALCP